MGSVSCGILVGRVGYHITQLRSHMSQNVVTTWEALRSVLSDYYKNNWPKVRSEIESRVSSYTISSEAKAAFKEALDAHEAGLYRCVSRVLFPEIDRMFRTEMFENKIGLIGSKDMIKELVAGKSELTHDKYLEDFMPNGIYELALFESLIRVLKGKDEIDNTKSIFGIYKSIRTEEGARTSQAGPCPESSRRHARSGSLFNTPEQFEYDICG